jgi:hypothetical protein
MSGQLKSAGTFAFPSFTKTICLAQSVLSPRQYFFLNISAVPGLLVILSLKNKHVGKHSQSAIFDSFQLLDFISTLDYFFLYRSTAGKLD